VKNFFISYAAHDGRWAEWIAWQLEEAGYSVEIQAWDFGTGNWVLRMNAAMSETERTIAVLSPQFFASAYTQPEWAGAFQRDPKGGKDLLIPVRVAEVELQQVFTQLTYVDFVGVPEAEASERLLKRVRGERGKPSRPPAFPGAAAPVRTIASKPPYPADEEDRQRRERAQELLLRWRGLYDEREHELREAMQKVHAWRGARPQARDADLERVLALGARVAGDLDALPIGALAFARAYGLRGHPSVFSGFALPYAMRAASSPLVPEPYTFELLERVFDTALALLRFRPDALPQGYIESSGVKTTLDGYRTLLVAAIDYDPALHVLGVNDAVFFLGTLGARPLALAPLCARRNTAGAIDLVAEDAHNVYVWSGAQPHPTAQYARSGVTRAAAFIGGDRIAAIDSRGTLRIVDTAGGEEVVTATGKDLWHAIVWQQREQWRAVAVTDDYGVLSLGESGRAERAPETLWDPAREWAASAAAVPGVVDGFPCVVVHRGTLDGATGVQFLDPVSLQPIRRPHVLDTPITSMTLVGGRWLLAFLIEGKQRILLVDLDDRMRARSCCNAQGEVYDSVIVSESRDAFELLFVLAQIDKRRRILCRFSWPADRVEELATYDDLQIIPVRQPVVLH
jgi:TIR domain